MTDELREHWLKAIERAEVRSGLESVYEAAAVEIAARGPACWASGRCCNFERTGHRLYVTGLEAAYTVSGLPQIAGTRVGNYPDASLRPLALAQAKERGGCPFQVQNLCGVHAIKPLGCRMYFCHRSAQAWQQELSEKLLAEIRGLHDRFAVEYRYGEWREMLATFVSGIPR